MLISNKAIAFWCFPEKKINVFNQPRTTDFPSWSLWAKMFNIKHYYGGHITPQSKDLFVGIDLVIMLMDNEMDSYVKWLKDQGKMVLLLEEMPFGNNFPIGVNYDYSLKNCDGILCYNPESIEYYSFYNKATLLRMAIANSYIHEFQSIKIPFKDKYSDRVLCGACYPNDVHNRMFYQTIDLIEKAGYKPTVVLRACNPSDSDRVILERCDQVAYEEDYLVFRKFVSKFRCMVYIDNLATVGRMPLVSALSGTFCCTNSYGYYGKRLFGSLVDYKLKFAESIANIRKVMTDEVWYEEKMFDVYLDLVKFNRDNKKTFLGALRELGFELKWKDSWDTK